MLDRTEDGMQVEGGKAVEDWLGARSPKGARAWLEQVSAGDSWSASLGRIVRSTPHRCTLFIQDGPLGPCYLKLYRPHAGRIGKVAGRASPALAEWAKISELRQLGIPVPRAIGAIGGRRGDAEPSALFLEPVAGGERLDHFLRRFRDPWLRRSWLPERLIPLLRAFHDQGFWHRDLYACHLLVEDQKVSEDGARAAGSTHPEPGEAARLVLIDLARVRRSKRLSRRRRVKDLAALSHSLRRVLSRSARLRLLLAYLDEPRLRASTRKLIRAIGRKEDKIRRHVPKYDVPEESPA